MPSFLRLASLVAVCALVASSLASSQQPVNPHATPEARALLALLSSISGKGIVTGQHNFPNDGSKWTDRAYDITGKYPGLFGEDFGFSGGEDKDSTLARPAIVEEIKRQYKNGSIIALTWHAVRPTDDEPVTFRDSVQGKLTDYEFQQLLTPGTPIYNRWCAQVDVIVGFLRQLRDANVPVLFRAYHEVNGNWFWWGYRPGPNGSAALYRQLYDRFVNVHHLDNLVWVWNVNAPGGAAGPSADYYPGAAYADVVTMDIYGEFKQEYYDDMLRIAAGKPIALGEVGGLPSLDVLAVQPKWTYFMAWSGLLESSSPADRIQAVYHSPVSINRDDPRIAPAMEAMRKSFNDAPPQPVSPESTAEARRLLAKLAAAPGKAPLGGIRGDATGFTPAILAADFDGMRPQIAGIIDSVKQRHTAVSLTYAPLRPTDNGPAKSALTDYEWNDLITPGTALNKLWTAQVDSAAEALREFQKAGIPVLFNAYPDSTGPASSEKPFWWAGRKGFRGSAHLYRMLFDRLVRQDGIRNLLWVWQQGPPSFAPGAGTPSDYFPGLLYVDAVQMKAPALNGRFPMDRYLAQSTAGKPIGIEITGNPPPPEAFGPHSLWSWFVVQGSPAQAEALKKLFAAGNVGAGTD
ncbi:glycosyl hydrolase [Terracidiphilus gabretensis]|uniref:glycosyl hydrolase n=1 Tax=Terracidiphilus gabretensis TaxID=1577687 RepID=UPI00071BD776|nr:glycosyl hydrolase [Terracidiphilus gabretensis]